jgi:hypothetical protein
VSCCARFRRGDWAALLADANAAEDAALPRAARAARPSATVLAGRIRRMVAGFKFSKPMQSIRDFFANAALPPADVILAKVKAKRPASYGHIAPPPAATPRLNLSFDAFRSALLDRLASSAAAPGASGMSDTLLARLLRHDSSDGALCMDVTYMLVAHLAAGRGSDRARHVLMVSRLVAIPKPTASGSEPDFQGIGITESYCARSSAPLPSHSCRPLHRSSIPGSIAFLRVARSTPSWQFATSWPPAPTRHAFW